MSDLFPWYAPYTGWAVALLLMCVGAFLVALGLRHREIADRRVCPKCRYDLRATPASQCSECGYVLRSEAEARRLGRRPWLVLLGVIVAAALPTWTVHHRVREYGWDYYTRLHPFYYFSPDLTLWSAKYNGYDCRIVEDRRRLYEGTRYYNRRLLISKHGRVVFTFDDGFINEGFAGVNSGPVLPALIDLDHDGTLELVCSSNPGGNSTPDFVHLFRLGDTLTVLNTYIPGHRAGIDIRSFSMPDPQGPYIAEGVDEAFQYFPIRPDRGGRVEPRMKFHITPTGLVLAPDLMRGPAPSIDREEISSYCSGDYPETLKYSYLLTGMTHLLYAGHWDDARALLDQTWWSTPDRKAWFLTEFNKCVNRSTYRDTLHQLGYHPPTPKQPSTRPLQ